ncbi:helix-turn-helix protein [Tenacibaculum skagerrakense]|uniref:Helix-turn-helix protein n=1 Tax=Tenacibaculum skagerrakense TaxID=186571 RepID=A0A4R2NXA7_9FLAO|nr:helix-turn-helix transcriptional regulator [Tenacibaculum skagerrakense]TCP26667.1 helix-turn-helix protein [Tenacibaculum skagerrakense]
MIVRDEKYIIEFGKNLRKLRKSKNITQEKLAFSIGIEISQISRIERGIVNTSISTVKAISDSLKIDIKELFDFEY